MDIQLITIGNELLNGKIQDLNGHWLAKFCYKNHINLQKVHIIGDNFLQFSKALLDSLTSSSVVIISGGLGPTEDDLTKSMMSSFFDKKIVTSPEALAIAQAHYKRGNREFDPKKIHYGDIPQDFIPINNPVGYAPGLAYLAPKTGVNKFDIITCAPGVPSEFQAMVEEEIYPLILKHKRVSDSLKKHVVIKSWKISESKIFNSLCTNLWDDLSAYGEVSSLPHYLGVDIGVFIQCKTQEEIEKKEAAIIAVVKASELATYIWHIGGESLEELIILKAKEKNLKIGFAESCTGGLLASSITDIAGSSAVLWGSVVSYSNEVKEKVLAVNNETLKSFGAVSLETAKEMAQGALVNMNVDIAISTTGIAGPGGGSKEKPVGTVAIGFATKKNKDVKSELFNFRGDRKVLKSTFTKAALYTLLEVIESH